MWRWRLKRWPKRRFFLLRLFTFCTVVHVLLLMAISFIQLHKSRSYQVTINSELNTNIQVIFLPLYKKVNREVAQLERVHKKSIQKNIPIKDKKKVVKTNKTIKKPQVTVQDAQKKVPKKNVKKICDTVKKVEKKQEHKKVPKKTKEEPKKKSNESTKIQKKSGERVKESKVPEKIYVGRHELESLQMQARIQKEVSTVWKPPVGLSKDLACRVMLAVDADGNVAYTKILKSSGVLLYDISARTALAQLTLPAWAYRKKFCITFKQ